MGVLTTSVGVEGQADLEQLLDVLDVQLILDEAGSGRRLQAIWSVMVVDWAG